MHPRIERGRSLTEQTADALREAIVAGELAPGELYSVAGLAESFNVSRTPLREALLGLADSGLVVVERNRGFRVVAPDRATVDQVFEARMALEVPAARKAAIVGRGPRVDAIGERLERLRAGASTTPQSEFMRRDREFHGAILHAAGNDVISGIVGGLRDTLSTLGVSTAEQSRGLQDIADEHIPIWEAIRVGDSHAAADAMRRHLQHTHDLLAAQMQARHEESPARASDTPASPPG